MPAARPGRCEPACEVSVRLVASSVPSQLVGPLDRGIQLLESGFLHAVGPAIQCHDLVVQPPGLILAGRELVDQGQRLGLDLGRPGRLRAAPRTERGLDPRDARRRSSPAASAEMPDRSLWPMLASTLRQRMGHTISAIVGCAAGFPAGTNRGGNRLPVVVGSPARRTNCTMRRVGWRSAPAATLPPRL